MEGAVGVEETEGTGELEETVFPLKLQDSREVATKVRMAAKIGLILCFLRPKRSVRMMSI